MTEGTVMDRVNADLKPGQYVMIRRWCREKSYYKTTQHSPFAVSNELTGDEAGAKPNESLFGDVIEVLAISWPSILVMVHTTRGNGDYSKVRTTLDCRDFECEQADAAYVNAMLAAAAPPPPPLAPLAGGPIERANANLETLAGAAKMKQLVWAVALGLLAVVIVGLLGRRS